MAEGIHNVLLVSPGQERRTVDIAFSDGLIEGIEEASPSEGRASESWFDGEQLYALPGFIDIHTHGANGCDLSMATEEGVRTIAEAKLKEGVTTFLPTTWTETPEALQAMARAVAAYRSDQRFARTPSLHVEGPYLNPAQAGAQNPNHMRPPNLDEVVAIHDICPVGLLSLAIELEGSIELIRALSDRGIVTSAAHSAASYAEFRSAREAGLTHLTHFCNQMSRLHHRSVGLVGAGLLDDEVMIELICDKIHLCPEMIELVFKHRSCEQLMLITDSMAASHLGNGDYTLNDGTRISVADGAARIDAGNLAGSTLRYDRGLAHVAEITGLPLTELVATTAANQARSLQLEDRGRLEPGRLADVVLLNEAFEVRAVFVGGEQKV